MHLRTITHRMAGYPLAPDTQILILGTFNPDTPGNTADFFYGRNRNYLWRLLPLAFGEPDLKGKSKAEKEAFLKKYHIGFADLIKEVQVETGAETNYLDDYLDSRVTQWTDVTGKLQQLKNLKQVIFTRKTLGGVPQIKKHVLKVAAYCAAHGIDFQQLITPARGYSAEKQATWTAALRAAPKGI